MSAVENLIAGHILEDQLFPYAANGASADLCTVFARLSSAAGKISAFRGTNEVAGLFTVLGGRLTGRRGWARRNIIVPAATFARGRGYLVLSRAATPAGSYPWDMVS